MSEEQMILENKNLVYIVLKQMGLYKNYEEWFDVGIIGLIKGIKNYDPKCGTSLSTFVCHCIKNEILLEIRKSKTDKRKANFNCISLEKEIYNNGKDDVICLKDTIPSNYDLETEVIKKDIINNILKLLSDEEKYVLVHYYGLFGNDMLNQVTIAKKLNVTQVQVCRILKKIFKKIRSKYENN